MRRSHSPRAKRGTAAVLAALFAAGALAATVVGGTGDTGRSGQASAAAPVPAATTVPIVAAPVPLPTPPGTTERVSVGADGAEGDAASGGVTDLLAEANGNQAISADGRWVAFVSAATNLADGQQPAGGLFLRDRQSRTTIAVPWVDAGPFPDGVTAAEPSISGDGGVVAFTAVVGPGSGAGGLVGRSTTPYVFAWDRQTNLTELVSADANGRPTPGFQPSVSADGRYVAYTAWAGQTAPPVLSNLTTTGYASEGQYFIFGPSASRNCNPQLATISVTATDPDDDVASVTLYYQPTGGTVLVAQMASTGSNVWTADIVAEDAWATGRIAYWVEGRDTQGNVSAPLHNAGNYLLNKGTCIL